MTHPNVPGDWEDHLRRIPGGRDLSDRYCNLPVGVDSTDDGVAIVVLCGRLRNHSGDQCAEGESA